MADESVYKISVFGNRVDLSYSGRLEKADAERFFDELRQKYPQSEKWYVVADRRQARPLTTEVANIIQKSIEAAAQNGMKFCVQIVNSATIKVQIMRLAKEKGLEDIFFPVMDDVEAKQVIIAQKAKHHII